MYTIETLTELNKDNSNVLPIREKDVEIINDIIKGFALNLNNPLPCSGDRVIIHGERFNDTRTAKEPKTYIWGHCEGAGHRDNTYSLCTQPMTSSAYISTSDHKAHCSTSGGYWINAVPEKFENNGETVEKLFWTWGSRGSGGHMGVYFYATVKQLSYTDLENIY